MLRSTSSGMKRTGELMTMNFALVEATLVEVAQAAPDLRRFAQRLVKVLEVEDGRSPCCAAMKSSAVRGETGARFGRVPVAVHAFGQAPGPDRQGLRAADPPRHLAQDLADPLFLGRADVGERTSGLEHLANHFGRTALFGLLLCRIFHSRIGVAAVPLALSLLTNPAAKKP